MTATMFRGRLSTAMSVGAGCTANNSTLQKLTCYDPMTFMNVKRTAQFVLVGGAAAVWLAAAATSGDRTGRAVEVTEITPADPRAAVLAAEIARLHERPKSVALPRQPVRNPFVFASTARRSTERPGPSRESPQHDTTTPTVALPPALKLVGIGEDETSAGTVRTAILSGSGDLVLAKEGDTVAGRYRVLRISSEIVELADVIDGATRRLVLK